MVFDFETLQLEAYVWARKNFPNSYDKPDDQLIGVVEEVGELAHARLKLKQGIRGTTVEHIAKGKDAVGDILAYLANYCNAEGWDMQSIIEKVWGEVKKRDWTVNKQDGSVMGDASGN